MIMGYWLSVIGSGGFQNFIHQDGGVQKKDFRIGIPFNVVDVVIEEGGNLGNLFKIEHPAHVLSGGQFIGPQAQGRTTGGHQRQ